MKQKKEFISADLYQTSFVSIFLGQFPSFKVESGKTLFIFPADAALYKAINAYNAGAPVNAFEFAQQIKRLRGEMYARKGAGVNEMEKRNGKENT